MPKQILLDEFLLDIFVAKDAGEETVNAIRKTLDGTGFRARLRRALRDCFREFTSLAETQLRISR